MKQKRINTGFLYASLMTETCPCGLGAIMPNERPSLLTAEPFITEKLDHHLLPLVYKI